VNEIVEIIRGDIKMSNQRGGKWKKASLDSGLSQMKLRNFFRDCKELLEENGEEDAAFYFEQVMDEINEGRSLPGDKRNVSKVLGL